MIKLIVFDIDGTLSDPSHRLKHIAGEKKDWDKFYSEVEKDSPIYPMLQLFDVYKLATFPQFKVVCITGRPERTREATLNWFKRYAEHLPDEIYMRKDHDYRSDVEVKKEWIKKLHEQDQEAWIAFEDRDRVVKMYRDLGIQCCQVAEGKY